jgi:hypothetical protein
MVRSACQEPMQSISLLLHLLCGLSPAAALPEVAVVGVHIPGVDAEAAEATNETLAQALEATGKVEALRPAELAPRLRGREELIISDAALNRGVAALDSGRALFERADTEGAIPLLEQAVARLDEGTRAVGDPKELVEAWLLLGLAQASQGDSEAALESWQAVAVLDPDLELDSIRYAPKIVDLFNQARAAAAEASSGTLTVSSAGGSAGEVRVDGRPVGRAPLSLEGLPAGTHYVILDTDDGARHLAVADLVAGEDLDLFVSEQSASLGRPAEDAVGRAVQTSELYKALGKYGETGLFLVGGVTEDRVSLCLYAPRTNTFSKALTAESGGDPAGALQDLVPSLASYLTESGGIRTDRVSPQVPGLDISANPVLTRLLFEPEDAPAEVAVVDGGEDGRGGRWLLWAGAGAVAAGGATAAVILLTGEEQQDPPENTGGGTVVFGPIP